MIFFFLALIFSFLAVSITEHVLCAWHTLNINNRIFLRENKCVLILVPVMFLNYIERITTFVSLNPLFVSYDNCQIISIYSQL